METAKQPLEELNKKIEAVEQQAQASVAAIGAKVEFPRIPLDKLPSFDDIQNFQTILHQPEVYCSPAFKEAMKPALEIPVIRVVFELLNIPTTDEGFAKACANQPASLADAMVDKLKPTVTLPQVNLPQVRLPPQAGGKTRRKRNKRRSTRRRA